MAHIKRHKCKTWRIHTHTHTRLQRGRAWRGEEGLRSAKRRWRWARPMCYVFIMYGAALNFQKDSCGPETADKHTRRVQLFHLCQTLITDAGRHGTLIVGHAIISFDTTRVLPPISRWKRAAKATLLRPRLQPSDLVADTLHVCMNKAIYLFIFPNAAVNGGLERMWVNVIQAPRYCE